jgi:CRP-like cAMP-binding protein
LSFSSIIELGNEDYLYQPGHKGGHFWFVLKGSLELLVKRNDEFKYSKTIDEASFFGQRKYYSDQLTDYAKVKSEKLLLLQF